jgi:hypothetical protein
MPLRRHRLDNFNSSKLVRETQPNMEKPMSEGLTDKDLEAQGFVRNLDDHVQILRGNPLP